MKRYSIATILILLLNIATSAAGLARGPISDLALIYQGGVHRIDWTPEEIEPYVTHRFADGSEKWLFDGFLFLEFKDGKGCQFSPGYDSKNACKEHWKLYTDRLFEPGKALHALDSVIECKKKVLGAPEFRHKVILTLLVPIPGQTDWGSVDGVTLDFNSSSHQLTAIQWFMEQLSSRFEECKFRNLDLHGFYWIDEDMVATRRLTPSVSEMVHSMGKLFYWIPYFQAPGHLEWKTLGFDMAYHQPNHFFDASIAD